MLQETLALIHVYLKHTATKHASQHQWLDGGRYRSYTPCVGGEKINLCKNGGGFTQLISFTNAPILARQGFLHELILRINMFAKK